MHTYSLWWIGIAAGLLSLSPDWSAKEDFLADELDTIIDTSPDTPIHPLECLEMDAWCKLPAAECRQVVREYLGQERRPVSVSQAAGVKRTL